MATKEFNITGNGVQYMNDVAQASEQSAQGFKSAKAELRALQNQMFEMDQSSEEFKKASARASELKDNISDLAQELSANAGNAFEQVSNNIGLFGDRIMSLDFKGAGIALSGFGNALGQMNFKTIKEELGGLIKGIGDMGKALLANPIFLIAGTIAGVIAYWDELSEAVSNFNVTQEESIDKMMRSEAVMKEMESVKIQTAQIELLVRAVNDHSKSEQERKGALVKVNQALEDNGIAAVNDINATEDVINAKNQLIQKLQQEAKVRGKLAYLEELYAEQSRLNANKGFTTTVSEANKAGLALLGLEGGFIQSMTDMGNGMFGTTVTELENIQKEIDAISEDIYNDQQAMADLSIKGTKDDEDKKNDIIKKGAQKRKKTRDEILQEEADALKKAMEEEKKREEERLKFQRDANNALLDERERIQEEIYQSGLSAEQKEISDIQDKYFEKIELAKQFGLDATNLELEQAQLIQGIKDKYAQAGIEKDKKEKEQLVEQQKAFNDAIVESEQKLSEAKWSVANAGLDLLGTLAGKNKKVADALFLVQKGMAIAQVVIDTQKEIAGYYSNPTWSLMPDGGLAIKTANAVGAKLRAVSSIATIVGSSIGRFMNGGSVGVGGNLGGGGGGNLGGGGMSPSPLSLSFLQNQPNQQPPFQAYVISGQVSNSIEAQQLINNQSKL